MDNKSSTRRYAQRLEPEEAQKRLAVLIDADNAQASIVEGLFEEIAKFGVASVKRIYGDWTAPQLGSWKKVLLEYSINPVQQFAYTKGKNATDSSLIIDAMDLLYTRRFDGFCLVSSDSDFTRLATRLREAGMQVYGIGEKKTPNPFIVACDKFIYLEILKKQSAGVVTDSLSSKQAAKDGVDKITQRDINLIADTIDDVADDDGWAFLGDVGSLLQKKQPNFDSRNYGFQKLTPLISSIGNFELERREDARGRKKLIYVKTREKGKKGKK
jgi:uncharacterized LabA/DUF88 family protein